MKIVILGDPIAKKRTKCTCRHGRPIVYDPQVRDEMVKVKTIFECAFKAALNSANKETVMEASELAKSDAFEVSCTFLFEKKGNRSLGRKNAKSGHFPLHTKKPDLDNLEKFYLDCLTGILWKDDAQVISLNSKKMYDVEPRAEITIKSAKKGEFHELS